VHLCAFVCVRPGCVGVCPCTRAFVSAHVGVFLHFHRIVSLRVCVFDVCVRRVCALRRCAGPLVARRGPVLIARPATRAAACACFRLCHRPVPRALAAGATWRLVIASAPWAARGFHKSVVDAAGAIYVIGGGKDDDTTRYKDVWASTDGGARTGLGRGGGRGGVLGGYSGGYDKGTTGLMQEYTGVFQSVIQGTPRLLCGT
jgi:hypothetical protein